MVASSKVSFTSVVTQLRWILKVLTAASRIPPNGGSEFSFYVLSRTKFRDVFSVFFVCPKYDKLSNLMISTNKLLSWSLKITVASAGA